MPPIPLITSRRGAGPPAPRGRRRRARTGSSRPGWAGSRRAAPACHCAGHRRRAEHEPEVAAGQHRERRGGMHRVREADVPAVGPGGGVDVVDEVADADRGPVDTSCSKRIGCPTRSARIAAAADARTTSAPTSVARCPNPDCKADLAAVVAAPGMQSALTHRRSAEASWSPTPSPPTYAPLSSSHPELNRNADLAAAGAGLAPHRPVRAPAAGEHGRMRRNLSGAPQPPPESGHTSRCGGPGRRRWGFRGGDHRDGRAGLPSVDHHPGSRSRGSRGQRFPSVDHRKRRSRVAEGLIGGSEAGAGEAAA